MFGLTAKVYGQDLVCHRFSSEKAFAGLLMVTKLLQLLRCPDMSWKCDMALPMPASAALSCPEPEVNSKTVSSLPLNSVRISGFEVRILSLGEDITSTAWPEKAQEV